MVCVQVQVLLGYTSGALQTVFSKEEIASQRAVLAAVAPAGGPVPEEAAAALGMDTAVDVSAIAFECPILLDDVAADNIVVLLAAGDAPWLVGLGERRGTCVVVHVQGDAIYVGIAEKPVVDALLDCPLVLLRNDMAPVLASLIARCDSAVSLAAMREVRAACAKAA